MAENRLYDYAETMERLHIGRSLMNELIAREEIIPTRIGRRRLFSDAEIERFIAAHTHPTNMIEETK